MKRILALGIAAALAAGCTDRIPTLPDPAPAPPSEQRSEAAPAPLPAGARDGIDDALERIVPALTDPMARQSLQAALARLRQAVSGDAEVPMPALIEDARREAERYARTGLDDADVDSILLALDHAAATLAH